LKASFNHLISDTYFWVEASVAAAALNDGFK
jgi:hypothetical protein